MESIIYYKHSKGLPYVSDNGEILLLPKGSNKTLAIHYPNRIRATYIKIKKYACNDSCLYWADSLLTLEKIHGNKSQEYDWLYLSKGKIRVNGKRIPFVQVYFFSSIECHKFRNKYEI